MDDPFNAKFPRIKGAHKCALLWSKLARAIGLNPKMVTLMKLGHKLLLDRRVGTEFWSFYSGYYEDRLIKTIVQILRDNEVFLDVGSNVGFFAIGVQKGSSSKGCRTIAFEPGSGNFDRLRENIQLNDMTEEIRVENLGLSSSSSSSLLVLREDYKLGGGTTGNASVLIDDGKDSGFDSEQIQLTTLDSYYQSSGIIGVIKLDIEGHENEFLLGAKNVILRHRPVIVMEANNWFYKRKSLSLESACSFLRSSGYIVLNSSGVPVLNIDAIEVIENVYIVPSEKLHCIRFDFPTT